MSEKSYMLVNGSRVDVHHKEYMLSLAEWLRLRANMLSVRIGCGTKKNCGICIVELEEKAVLACSIKMHSILGQSVVTVEGIPEPARMILADILLQNTAVPCGYCTAGILVKIYTLIKDTKEYTKAEITTLLGFSSCTCLGAKQIIDIVLEAQTVLHTEAELPVAFYGGVPSNSPRFGEKRIVLGERPFVEDLFLQENVFHAVILWNNHSFNTLKSINIDKIRNLKGIHQVITAKDIKNNTVEMPDMQKWNLFLDIDEVGYCKSEIIAIVIGNTRENALHAIANIEIISDIYSPYTDIIDIFGKSLAGDIEILHHTLHYGAPIESLLEQNILTVSEVFNYAPNKSIPLEKPSSLAISKEGHIYVYTQVADISWLRYAIANALDISASVVHCIRSDTNILFNTREDYFLALTTAIASYITQSSVRMEMSHDEVEEYRSESISGIYDYTLLLTANGYLLGAKIAIMIDAGAYTTDLNYLCTTVMKHATSGYNIPNIDISLAVISTNSTPKALMRGKNLEPSTIVMNRLLDKFSKMTRFNRHEIRVKNILKPGMYTALGEYLFGNIETESMLNVAKTYYDSYPSVSISISALDSGLTSTNAMCMVAIDILQGNDIVIYQPYPEYGNGLSTLIAQTVTGILGKDSYEGISIRSTTDCMAEMQSIPDDDGAMLYLAYHATKDAAEKVASALSSSKHFSQLWGERYIGFSSISTEFIRDTDKYFLRQGNYSFITHLARCEEPAQFIGLVVLVDVGTPFNSTLCKSIIEGGISVCYNSIIGETRSGMQPVSSSIDYINGTNNDLGYAFKGVYDISSIGLASSLYSFLWINSKKNIKNYPL